MIPIFGSRPAVEGKEKGRSKPSWRPDFWACGDRILVLEWLKNFGAKQAKGAGLGGSKEGPKGEPNLASQTLGWKLGKPSQTLPFSFKFQLRNLNVF